jgi:hypothetical protein
MVNYSKEELNMLKRPSTSTVSSKSAEYENDLGNDSKAKKQKTESKSGGGVEQVNAETVIVSSLNTPALPEGFFDDPEMDAKARGVDRTKNLEAEYEEFKKLMQTEEVKSDVIVEKDDTSSYIDRDLLECDELINRWSKIEDLHKKREAILSSNKKATKLTEKPSSVSNKMNLESVRDNESDQDGSDVDLENVLSLDIRDKKRFK